jgi:uncharacterized protein (DUF433 family)
MCHERIDLNPDVMNGKPIVRGTRVPVDLVLRKLDAGMTPEAIVIDHPWLTHDDVRAVQAFAADAATSSSNVWDGRSRRRVRPATDPMAKPISSDFAGVGFREGLNPTYTLK